ncbi:MAG TPA: hypothetical protein VH797_09930 [Nitrososphaeraceae archaeon]|jgi:hypothetical protein
MLDKTQSNPLFPAGVTAISDIIKIVEDMGNQIPDKSWMLYLLELFNARNIPIELNLICQFDNQDYFEAIFQGINRYRFKKVLPVVGHSYLRIIMMYEKKRLVRYSLTDQTNGNTETFDFPLDKMNFDYVGGNQFTGIEWWNKTGNFPYSIRYNVEVSQLMFGFLDKTDSDSITFVPHNSLIPNSDNSGAAYPVSFRNIMLKDGCVCYSVEAGNCNNGIHYSV